MARTLSIVALFLAILVHPIGLVLGIVAYVRSRRMNETDWTALAAIIIATAFIVVRLFVLWLFGVF